MTAENEGPCYVEFEMRAVEDRHASMEAGHHVDHDVAFVKVTPPGGNLTIEKRATKWIEERRKVGDPHADLYERQFNAWQEGQEIPVEGTAIRTCPIYSPAEVKRITDANIRTVEDMSKAPEEALQKMGMGARALKQKAEAYLDAASGTGKTAQELTTLRRDNETMREELDELRAQVKAMNAASVQKPKRGRPKKRAQPEADESADEGESDAFGDEEAA